MKYVGLMIPDDFLETFDACIKGKYAHRSDAIREGMRMIVRNLDEEKRQREASNDQGKM